MKTLKFIAVLIVVLAAFNSCEKDTIELYQQDPGVYFSFGSKLLEYEYSFFSNPGKATDTINLDVFITGDTTGVDRKFKVVIIPGENTTALEDQYELLEGTVPAGENKGVLPIVVTKTPELDADLYSVELELAPTDDFYQMDFARANYKVSFTSQVVMPPRWNKGGKNQRAQTYFGDYSNNWYLFIVTATGDPEIGTGNIFYEASILSSYVTSVTVALRTYNNTHAEPLKHDDGTVVVMP